MKEKDLFRNRNKSRRFVKITAILFIATYAFLLSGRLYLTVEESYPSSAIGREIVSGNKKVRLVRWDYCEEQGTMEIELDIETSLYEKGEFLYEAINLDGTSVFSSNAVLESSTNYVIQVTNIPKKEKTVVLRLGYKTEEKTHIYSFAGNKVDANKVNDLTPKTEIEYKVNRLVLEKENCNNRLIEIEASILKQQNLISEIQTNINELEASKSLKTADEIVKINEQIANYYTQIEDIRKEISVYEMERIEVNQKITALDENITSIEQMK